MTPAVIKLESFSAARRQPEPSFDRADLEAARAEGLAQGLARRDSEQLQGLRAGLDRLAQAMVDDAARRHAIRSEAVAALAPVLSAILDALTPAAASQRLERSLLAELERLADQTPPLCADLICGPDLRPMVERCIQQSGLQNIRIEERSDATVSLNLQGGRIEFSQDSMTRQIRALIEEIKQDTPTWTH